MPASPLVSVVIPVRNSGASLAVCLDSVLAQSFTNFEVVIGDHGSTDGTRELIESYSDPRIRILPDTIGELSMQGNWDRVMCAASGDFVKLLCHDDVLLPECLDAQSRHLVEHPEAVLVSNRRQIIDERGRVLLEARGLGGLLGGEAVATRSASEVARACVRAGTNLLGEPACVLVRRSALRAPHFGARWSYAIDLEFYLRCLRFGEAVVDREVQACFRVSPRQLSAALASQQASELRALFAEFRREYPDDISRRDLQAGAARSTLLSWGRRALYRRMRIGNRIMARRRPSGSSR